MIEWIYFYLIIFSQKEMRSKKHTADVVLPGQQKHVLVRNGRDAMILFTFFLMTIDPAHHIYIIQLTEHVFL